MAERITTISFDGDGTLWNFEKVMRHSLAITLDELRHRVPIQESLKLTVDKMIKIRNTAASELKGKTVNLEEIRLHAFKRTIESIGYSDDALAADLNELYLKHRFEDIELYPDVFPTMDALHPQFSLGLISNGNSYPERCGLQDRFSFVVFSQDVGAEKPDSRIFFEACRQAGCMSSELLHVGDSLESDVAGANASGATSVWINREGIEIASNVQPNHVIRALTEMIDIARKKGGG